MLATVCILAIVAAGLMPLAPVRFGGQTAYLVTHGNSMEPGFHSGDLAITHQAEAYATGDVVAYKNPELGVTLHRIVAQDGDRFSMEGDHNTWIDAYHPQAGDMVGKLWIRVPALGGLMNWARSPAVVAVLTGLIGVFVMAEFRGDEKRPRRRRRGHTTAPGSGGFEGLPGSVLESIWTAVAVVGIASLALAFFSFRTAPRHSVPHQQLYEQSGSFSYAAAAPAGMYDTAQAASGDPVFSRLADKVDGQFRYQFSADAPHAVRGSYHVTLELSQDNGWRRTMELVPETPFSGDSFNAAFSIDLAQVQAFLRGFASRTGVRSDQFTLTILPSVQVDGNLGGGTLQTVYSPPLAFKLDPIALVLLRPNNGASDPLSPTQGSAVQRPRNEPASLSLLFLHLPVALGRVLAIIGLAVAGLGALVATVCGLLAREGDEPARIRARYAPMLLDVLDGVPDPGVTLRVGQIDDLVKFARQDSRMILHQDRGACHRYFVSDGQVVYQYTTKEPAVADLAAAVGRA